MVEGIGWISCRTQLCRWRPACQHAHARPPLPHPHSRSCPHPRPNAQLVATIGACFTANLLVDEGLPSQALSVSDLTGVVGLNTMLLTFLVVFVHLNVLGAQENNGLYGYAVGFAYIAAIWIFGGANGASAANPFLAIGIAAAKGDFSDTTSLGLLVALPFVAAALASVAFKAVSSGGAHSKLVAEALGTALLAFGLVASQEYGGATAEGFGEATKASGTAAGMDIGALYIALTCALAYASSAALNPAITIATVFQNSMDTRSFLQYFGLQVHRCLRLQAVPRPPCFPMPGPALSCHSCRPSLWSASHALSS